MSKPLYIYSSSNYHHPIDNELPRLNSELEKLNGANIRRIDRFTQLALIGSLHCKSEHIFPKATGLYLSSIYGSLSNTNAVLSEIYQHGHPPKPLNFINSVSNAACFYLAKYLQIIANNQFVSRDHFTLEAGLKLASIDLEVGNIEAAIIGVVCEVDKNISIHRKRLKIDQKYSLAEGSHWLYLAHQLEGKNALAKITHISEPVMRQDLHTYLKEKVCNHDAHIKIGFGDAVDTITRENILQLLKASEVNFAPDHLRHELSTALHICGFIEACKISAPDYRYVYLDTDGENRWSVVALEKEPKELHIHST